MNIENYNPNTGNSEILSGRAFRKLEDKSYQVFTTDDIDSFVEYCNIYEEKENTDLFLEASTSFVKGFRGYKFDNVREEECFAECAFFTSEYINSLSSVNSRYISDTDMQSLLKKMRVNIGTDGLELLDNIMDLSISKITKIRKSKKGANYNYSVSRESAGMDDFVPPKKLSFNVPVFAGFENEAIFTFDFDFDYKEDDGQVRLFFKIENLSLIEILLEERKRIIKEHLSFIGRSKILWGSRKKYLGTDEWSFRNCEKE